MRKIRINEGEEKGKQLMERLKYENNIQTKKLTGS